jgi:hypothetical protein
MKRRRAVPAPLLAKPARDQAARSRKYASILLDFLMRLVLPAMPAELLHFQALGGRLLVLGRGVIPVLALRALERNDIAGHSNS